MNRTLLHLALTLGLALSACAAPIYNCGSLSVHDNAIVLDRQGTSLYKETFGNGIAAWTIDNFESILSFTAETVNGESALQITNRKKDGDTAWELISPRTSVQPGTVLTLRTRTRGAYSLAFPSPSKASYHTAMFWYDAQGRMLPGYTTFSIQPSPDAWLETLTDFTVPPKAAKAEIHFGADAPNLNVGQAFAISEVELLGKTAQSPCATVQSFESSPKRIASPAAPVLSWNAACPGNSKVSFQIATAPDANGNPGAWTAFAGPDGTARTVYSASAAVKAPAGHIWYKYKGTLIADGHHSPRLMSVSLGDITDSDWTKGNALIPQVILLTSTPNPDPMAVLRLGIRTQSPLNMHTLHASLDGRDITPSVTRTTVSGEERLTYTPATPFAPNYTPFTPWLWDIGNNRYNLAITHIADSPTAMHVQSRYATDKDTSISLYSQYRPVIAGQTYSLSFNIRHNLNLTDTQGAFGRILWYDNALKPVGSVGKITVPPMPVRNWSPVSISATAPENAAFARIGVNLDTPNLIGEDFIDVDAFQFTGALPENPASPSPNLHLLRITGEDLDGHAFDEDVFFCIGTPFTQNIVTMRDDGCLLIDGKPFFPIGLYGIGKKPFNQNSYDIAFRDLAANGFNFAQTYSARRGKDLDEFMDAAEKHHIKIWYGPTTDYAVTFFKEARRPCMLAWYLGDDTSSYATPDGVKRLHRILHAIDNAHLTTQADSVGGHGELYEPFVHSTDSFLPELYPVRNATPDGTEVSEIITSMKSIHNAIRSNGSPVKPILPIIQYFDGWDLWHRYPTRDELYAMTYLSIIYGANGMTWYSYGGDGKRSFGVTYTPERWADICGLARQLSRISDKLTARNAANQPQVEILSGPTVDLCHEPAVHCLLKDSDGRKLLIAASSSQQETKVRILVNGFSKATAIFENRTLNAANGITDSFKPYGVHVYELE